MFWSVSSGLEETKLPRDSKTGGSLRTREDEREGGRGWGLKLSLDVNYWGFKWLVYVTDNARLGRPTVSLAWWQGFITGNSGTATHPHHQLCNVQSVQMLRTIISRMETGEMRDKNRGSQWSLQFFLSWWNKSQTTLAVVSVRNINMERTNIAPVR